MDNEKKYYPGQECSQCKGKCCREHGCALSPSDLLHLMKKDSAIEPDEICRENLLNLLTKEESYLAIDHFQNPSAGTIFYLRVRHKCYTFIGVDAIGECMLLTDTGCRLSFQNRPFGGKSLISSPAFHCQQEYTGELMAKDWLPYQEILSSIWQEYYKRFTEDGTFDRCDDAYFQYLRSKSAH